MDRYRIQHELRTPTGVILGYAEMLDNEVMTVPEIRTAVRAIRKSAKRLNEAIDELMQECRDQETKEQSLRLLLRAKILEDEYVGKSNDSCSDTRHESRSMVSDRV